MKLTYFFPVFREDDCEEFFTNFLQTNFFLKNQAEKIIVVLNQDDEKNLQKIKKIAKKHQFFMIFTSKKQFSYNSALKSALDYFDGDVLLLGDLKTKNIQFIFEKCLEKHKKGAKVVNVKKANQSIFARIWQKIYGGFTKLFTNKKDDGALLSLGLIDKDVLDIMKSIPDKAIFIKNVDYNYNLPLSTLYIDKNVAIYKENFFKKTFALKMLFVSSALFVFNLLLLVLLNLFLKDMVVFNCIAISVEFLLLVLVSVSLPKQIFDCRNIVFEEENICLELQKIDKNVRAKNKDAK